MSGQSIRGLECYQISRCCCKNINDLVKDNKRSVPPGGPHRLAGSSRSDESKFGEVDVDIASLLVAQYPHELDKRLLRNFSNISEVQEFQVL